MLRNKLYSILLLGFIVNFCFGEIAVAERVYGQIEPPPFELGRFAIKSELDVFEARSNFSDNGSSAGLVGDFRAFNTYLGVENDLSSRWSVGGGLLAGLSQSSLGGESRKNLDFKGLQFIVNRLLSEKTFFLGKKFRLIGDLKFFYSFYENSFGSDEVSIGDGVNWLQAGVWAGTNEFKHFRLWMYGGLHFPLETLSKNFVFVARPEFKLWGGRLGVGVEGQIPVIEDSDTNEPTNRLRLIDEYNGGSFYYQALNSKYVGLGAWFGYEPAPLTEIKFGISDNVWGESAPRGLRLFVSLSLSFAVTGGGNAFPYIHLEREKSKVRKNKGVRRLKNYAKPKGKDGEFKRK